MFFDDDDDDIAAQVFAQRNFVADFFDRSHILFAKQYIRVFQPLFDRLSGNECSSTSS